MSAIPVDWLIVTGKAKPDIGKVTEWFKPDLLILDSSVRNYQADRWFAECTGQGISMLDSLQAGRFCLERPFSLSFCVHHANTLTGNDRYGPGTINNS